VSAGERRFARSEETRGLKRSFPEGSAAEAKLPGGKRSGSVAPESASDRLSPADTRHRPTTRIQTGSEDELNVHSVAYRRTIGANAGTKAERQQDVAQLSIVRIVPRWIESQQGRIPFLVNVEPRCQMISLDARRCGKRRKKELRGRGRIISRGSAASARPAVASGSWPDPRTRPTSASGTSARGARVSAPACSGDYCSHTGRSCRGRLRSCRDRRSDRLWRRDNDLWRNYSRRRISDGLLDSDEVQALFPSLTAASTTPTRRTGATSALRVLPLEIVRGERIKNQEDDYRMHKKRGGDTLPPPLSSTWYADWRPIANAYFCSFGDTPITLTPDPRATSIA
jgi:hypothetical protein